MVMLTVDTVDGYIGGFRGAMAPQDAKAPGCHIAMCDSILGAFGVSAQFGRLQLYSLDAPVDG